MKRALVFAALVVCAAVSAHAQTVCQTYVVEAGDSVGIISQKFGILTGDLNNALSNCSLLVAGYQPGQFLQVGQRICLPGWVPACLNVQAAGGVDACKYYTVQSGDTLASIAASLGLTQLDLQSANPDKANLQVNDFVKLPGWTDSCPAPGDNTQCRVYIAEQGDSLAAIATAFSVNVQDLQAANPNLATVGDAAAILQPGQRINIPPFDAACGNGVVVQKPSGCRAYIVMQGDTLSSIAVMFQTSSTDLVAVNPSLAAGGVLSPGIQVLLPPADANCVNPTIVSAIPSPPMPPSPPLSPPPPPAPPATPSPSPSPSPEPVVTPVIPEAPQAAPEAAPAPEVGMPAMEPAAAPAAEPMAAPTAEPTVPSSAPALATPAPAPEAATVTSGAAKSVVSILAALLAVAGATFALA